jgi:Uma2 family endonuclease
MPVAIHGPLDAEPIARKLWTREERDGLVLADLLDGRRFELIEGELVEKVKNHSHNRAVMLLLRWLNSIFAPGRALQEASILLSDSDTLRSDPEPDAIVLNRPYDDFRSKAGPGDIDLIVEVSYSSINLDTTAKARLYARAGIPDYWVLDLRRRHLIVHRGPIGGVYQSIMAFGEDEQIAPLAAPHATVRARDFLKS